MAGISSKATGGVENKKKFNEGTEYNSDFDINLYETNFRSLDPQLGRFWQVDPLADVAYEYSPFTYGNNNPLTFNDPLGLISDSAHKAITLENVTVTSQRKASKQFLPYINSKFPNGYSIASDKERPINLLNKPNSVLRDWVRGTGAENRVYLPNHHMTKRLKNAHQINLARAFFYKKYLTNFLNKVSMKQASVTNFKGGFGPLEFMVAGGDIVEQFVGSFGVDIQTDETGENLLFIVSNTTGKESAYYHLPFVSDVKRSSTSITPEGNLHQVYIWKEPILSSGFTNLISSRPANASPSTGVSSFPFQ